MKTPLVLSSPKADESIPNTILVSSVLSQDFSDSAAPVICAALGRPDHYPVTAFLNPYRMDLTDAFRCESLVVSKGRGGGEQPYILYVGSRSGTQTGWSATKCFTELTERAKVRDVAAATVTQADGASTVYGFLLTDAGLYRAQLVNNEQGATEWTAPIMLSATPATDEMKLRVANSKPVAQRGQFRDQVLYTSLKKSALWFFHPEDAEPREVSLPSGISVDSIYDYTVVATSDSDVMIFAGIKDTTGSGLISVRGIKVDSTGRTSGGDKEIFKAKKLHSSFFADLNTIVVAYTDERENLVTADYRVDGTQDTATNNSSFGVQDIEQVVYQAIPSSTSPTKANLAEGFIHVLYVRDRFGDMRVVRGQFDSEKGTVSWMPIVRTTHKLVFGISGMAGPVSTSALFVVDNLDQTNLPELRFGFQDEASSEWRWDKVRTANAEEEKIPAAESVGVLSSYLIEALLLDEDEVPIPDHEINIRISSGAKPYRILISGTVYFLSSKPTTVRSDPTGRLILSLSPEGIGAPELELTAGSVIRKIRPEQDIFAYLSGEGVLNPTNPGGSLPQFTSDGEVLKKIAPDFSKEKLGKVAEAIQSLAKKSSAAQLTGVNGFRLMLSPEALEDSHPIYIDIATPAELSTAIAAVSSNRVEFYGSIWDSLWNLLQQGVKIAQQVYGDIAESIGRGATAVADLIVDIANGVVTFVLKGIEEAEVVVKMLWRGIQDLASLVLKTAELLGETAGKKLAEMLTAEFDVKAIWRTKLALDRYFKEGLIGAKENLGKISEGIENWAAELQGKTQENVQSALIKFKDKNLDKAPLKQLGKGQGEEGEREKILLSQRNPHANWLDNKISHALPSMSASPSSEMLKIFEEDQWGEFSESIKNAGSALGDQGFVDSANLLGDTLLNDLKSGRLSSVDTTAFFDAIEKVISAALKVGASVTKAAIGFLIRVVDLFQKIWDSSPDFGIFNPLIRGIWKGFTAEAGGAPQELTVGSLVTLLAAFPVTAMSKLLLGREPFPADQRVGIAAPTEENASLVSPVPLGMVSGMLNILQVIPTVYGDGAQVTRTRSVFAACMGWGLGVTALALRMAADGYAWSGVFEDYLTAAEVVFGLMGVIALGSRYLTVPPTSYVLAAFEGVVASTRAIIEILKLTKEQAVAWFRALADLILAIPGVLALATIGGTPIGVGLKEVSNVFGFPVGGTMLIISYWKPA